MKTCRRHQFVSWSFQLLAAVILWQTLFFKFTGAVESKYIFTTLGVEPWGRVASGLLELVASLLLLRNQWAVIGAGLAFGLMTGAMVSHLTVLGLIVQGDGGLLFALAVTVFGASTIVLWLRRAQIPVFGSRFFGTPAEVCPGIGKRS